MTRHPPHTHTKMVGWGSESLHYWYFAYRAFHGVSDWGGGHRLSRIYAKRDKKDLTFFTIYPDKDAPCRWGSVCRVCAVSPALFSQLNSVSRTIFAFTSPTHWLCETKKQLDALAWLPPTKHTSKREKFEAFFFFSLSAARKKNCAPTKKQTPLE